jgi:hypothetical protein
MGVVPGPGVPAGHYLFNLSFAPPIVRWYFPSRPAANFLALVRGIRSGPSGCFPAFGFFSSIVAFS